MEILILIAVSLGYYYDRKDYAKLQQRLDNLDLNQGVTPPKRGDL